MESRNSQPETADPDQITFQVQRLVVVPPGRLEVSGHWYGIRGRRFVRPTLTLLSGGSPVRLLADLEQKPWATEDGEEWLATFPFEGELQDASELELSVAPDIAVKLGDGPMSAGGAMPLPASAPAARTPRVRSDPGRARPMLTERARELERLNIRIAGLDQALERERARRATAEHELEDERTEARKLRSQAGRLRAELDLARARQSEMESISAELEAARRELAHQRAQGEQLRGRVARAEAALARAEAAAAGPAPASAVAGVSGAAPVPSAGRAQPESGAAAQVPSASAAQPESAAAGRSRLRVDAAAATQPFPRPHAATGTQPFPRAQPAQAAPPPRSPAPAGRERPLNPSLRHRTNWLGRILAVLIILAVIAAVVLVIRTTVSP